MLSLDLTSAPLSGSLADETDESSSSSSSSSDSTVDVDAGGGGGTRGEIFSSSRDGVSGLSRTRGDTRTSLTPPPSGSSVELALPLASTIFFGRPRARLAGVGASSWSGLPSSRPESLSAGLGSLPPPACGVWPAPLRVLMRTLGGRTMCEAAALLIEIEAGVTTVVLVALEGTLKLLLLLLLLLEVPFFSASVSGSSMIMQSELEPSSFSMRSTLVMLVAVATAAAVVVVATTVAAGGSETGGEGVEMTDGVDE